MGEIAESREVSVLLSSAGRRVGLQRTIREAGKALGVSVRIVACDLAPEASAACHLADISYGVPAAGDPAFITAMVDIARREKVSLIVPTIDTELSVYAEARSEFEAAGTWVNVGDPPSIAMCRDKATTARVLQARGVSVPKTVDLEMARSRCDATAEYDVVVKPTSGSAGRSITNVSAGAVLPPLGKEPMIAQERLVGPEYTVNVFVDRAGTFRCAVPHRRLAVRAGEVEKGVTVRDSRLTELARKVASAVPGLRGVFCFQAIDDTRRGLVVFEINARFGGGYPLAHAAGATFTRWLLEERLGLMSTAHDAWEDGLRMLRYDEAVFVRPDPMS